MAFAYAIAIAVEVSRLIHSPALEASRLTLAGQLLLGRTFSMSNIVAYGIGIAGSAGIDASWTERAPRSMELDV